MTRDEILNMQAGQDIDILISDEVLKHDADQWNRRFFNNNQNYSTDMRAVWEVVEKMREYIPKFGDESENAGIIWNSFIENLGYESMRELMREIDPLAICRAALLAVMENK